RPLAEGRDSRARAAPCVMLPVSATAVTRSRSMRSTDSPCLGDTCEARQAFGFPEGYLKKPRIYQAFFRGHTGFRWLLRISPEYDEPYRARRRARADRNLPRLFPGPVRRHRGERRDRSRTAVRQYEQETLMSESFSLPTRPEDMVAALVERFNSGKV